MSHASTDHRDLALEMLAIDEAALVEQLVDRDAEYLRLRELNSHALTALHDAHATIDRLREQLAHSRDENRAMRVHFLRQDAA